MNITQYDAMNPKQRDQFAGKRHANRLIERLDSRLSMHKKYDIDLPPLVDLAHEMIMMIETIGQYPWPYGVAVIDTLKGSLDLWHSEHGLFYKALEYALSHNNWYHGKRHDEMMRKAGKSGCLYCSHVYNTTSTSTK